MIPATPNLERLVETRQQCTEQWSGREYLVVMPQHPGAWLRVSTTQSVRAM